MQNEKINISISISRETLEIIKRIERQGLNLPDILSRGIKVLEKEMQEENCKIEVSEVEKAIKEKLKKDKINYEYLNIVYKRTIALVYLDGFYFGIWDILQNDMVGLEVEEWEKLI